MLIEQLRLKRILSFHDATVKLGRLNVLIGPNGVGKSNLIEVLGLLRATPAGLAPAIQRGGGVRQWLWLGEELPLTATVECDFRLNSGRQAAQLRYLLEISGDSQSYLIRGEELTQRTGGETRYFSRSYEEANVFDRGSDAPSTSMQVLPQDSVFSQFKNPADVTPITATGREFADIQIFHEFRTGPGSPVRQPASTHIRKDRLEDGGGNLAMVLQEFSFHDRQERIQHYLARFCERFENVKVDVGDGLASIFLSETGFREKLSAVRMSDGTLKFLALLAALFHPKPPQVMCIEEPELGLHPDALQIVADVLVEACESIQLIVTTHSDALVDALTDRPESVLVCERDFENGTQMRRLSKKKLKAWLERYSLGELWRKGEIGGGRW